MKGRTFLRRKKGLGEATRRFILFLEGLFEDVKGREGVERLSGKDYLGTNTMLHFFSFSNYPLVHPLLPFVYHRYIQVHLCVSNGVHFIQHTNFVCPHMWMKCDSSCILSIYRYFVVLLCLRYWR